MSTSSATQTILQRVFGYDTFRGPQQAIIEHVAAGHDALVLMPTGAAANHCATKCLRCCAKASASSSRR